MSNAITHDTHDTRDAGLQAIRPFVGNIQENVFEAVRLYADGRTAEQVDAATGVGLNNARSRCTELFKAGRFVVIGKRPNAKGTRMIAVYAAR